MVQPDQAQLTAIISNDDGLLWSDREAGTGELVVAGGGFFGLRFGACVVGFAEGGILGAVTEPAAEFQQNIVR